MGIQGCATLPEVLLSRFFLQVHVLIFGKHGLIYVKHGLRTLQPH